MMGEIGKENLEKTFEVTVSFNIKWDNFEKIAISFDFTQHHFDRLTFLVLTNCYIFFSALIVVSPSMQNGQCSSISGKFRNENHLFVLLLVDIVTQFSLRLKTCSVTCELLTNSRKQFDAMRVRNFLGTKRHFVITEPRNILLFRLQHLSMKLSGLLFHRFRKLYQP